ncbi:DUF2938 domain-containing protein [Pseudomonas matsuisoli]|uniref:Membrane protein n=1 Tax=Pseudomonas matsuisoli TaxID=1515666 RepID=A0A917UXM0_9PSED|nr:DUF2938 domain-containing protein [Pseudomonas matsuisoli]GGJ93517.1 membrane protein [Pseudomonas matsuisoli]
MTHLPYECVWVLSVGVGATAFMDVWLMFLRGRGVAVMNFAFLGRWVGHLCRGVVVHPSIARAAPVWGEHALGWATHYVTGIAFAGLLAVLMGTEWIESPTLLPALAVGIVTVVAPLLIVQPAMGAGIAGRNTPNPSLNVVKSIANHAVFGLGLYSVAMLMTVVS